MFSLGSLPWGDIIGGAAQLGTALYGAKKNKTAAKQAGQMATPVPYGTSSMYGTTTVDPRTKQISYGMGQNPFAQLFNQGGMASLAGAYGMSGAEYGGASPEIVAAAKGMFGPEMAQEAAGRLATLREIAAPEEARQTQGLESRLFAMGRLGGTGGAAEQEALARAQHSADLERTLASQDWAQNRAMTRFGTALQAVGAGQERQKQQFGMGLESVGGLQNLFQMLLAQGQQGNAAAAGMPAEFAAAAKSPTSSILIPALQESGAFSGLGKWIGGKLGGGTAPVAPKASFGFGMPSPAMPGPWAGGYNLPQRPVIGGFGV